MAKFFHSHVHSGYSTLDAISPVPLMVQKAHAMKQPALSMTDHGLMSGVIQLYRECKKLGLMCFPGMEGYLVENTADPTAKRYHLGLLALTFEGYQALVKLTSISHTREKFHRFPRFDWTDLAELSEEVGGGDLAVLTGCYFGIAQQVYVEALRGEWEGHPDDLLMNVISSLAQMFPTTLVEIQNHRIDHDIQLPGDIEDLVGDEINDKTLCKKLVRVANTLGLPVIATQDAHYLDQKDKPAHEVMKRMVYGKGEENEFPGDSFHLASTEWVERHHFPEHWQLSEEGAGYLLSLNDMSLPAVDNYRPRIPSTVENPLRHLKTLCKRALRKLYREGKLHREKRQTAEDALAKYESRLRYEFDIIEYLNIAGYFTLVMLVIEYCNKRGKAVEARGSSNASLAGFLLGINSVDPIMWGLTFERFLSKDRKKPPDIDLDVEDTFRPELVQFIDAQIGTVHISTFSDLGSRSDGKGSVLVSYNSYLRKHNSKEEFARKFGPQGVQLLQDVANFNRKDYLALERLSGLTPKKSYGTHASGLLVNGDDIRISDYVPTMLIASSGTRVTQFEQDDCEHLGLTKLDILGQKTLTKMVNIQRMIGREDPTDFSWIPFDDLRVCKALSSGKMNTGVFTFEAYSMAKGSRQLQIRKTFDANVAQAIFRPACLDSGITDLYIERRKQKVSVDDLNFPHEAFREATRGTYGLVVFQEQVLDIMRRLGLSYEDINTFFAIVKDSGKGAIERNQERANEVKKRWDAICRKNRIKDRDAAWKFIEGYTHYGFNKAHATGYGIRGYRDQYLKVNYPLEHITATLQVWAGEPKEREYIMEARREGFKILSPDVNLAGPNWTIDRDHNAVRKGLASVKGVSLVTAERIAAEAPFTDLDDLVNRTNTGSILSGGRAWLTNQEFKGIIRDLKEAGALSSLGYRKD